MNNPSPILAFHGSPQLASATIVRVKKHVDAKQMKQGIYVVKNGNEVKYVSSMGAIIYGSNGSAAESLFGIPADLMELQESLFDALEKTKSPQWPLWFLGVMRCGADLRSVSSEFFIWLLADCSTSVLDYVSRSEEQQAIMEAAQIHRERNKNSFWGRDESIMLIWEPKMQKLIKLAKNRGDGSAHLGLMAAFFSLYARFSVGGALSSALRLYAVTVDGESNDGGQALMVSASAKELLRIIREK